MNKEMILKVLDLLDNHVECTEKLTGQSRDEQETIYAGLSTMAEFIITDGYSQDSYYEGIEFNKEAGKHFCKCR